MRWRHIRHLPVVERGRLVGLVTHRDLVRAQAQLLARPAHDLLADAAEELSVLVLAVMQRNVWRVTPETPVMEAARIMLDHKFGCLPVVDSQDQLVGIVTEVDLLRLLVRHLSARREVEDTNPGVRRP
jgi:CBS domain-containing protein